MSRIVKAGPGLHIGDHVLAQTIDRDRIVSSSPNVIDGHRLKTVRIAGKTLAVGEELKAASCACDNRLDISWLKFAAEQYHISPKIEDYVLLSVPIVVATFPNRNHDAFPYEEITKWRSPVGRVAFQTFISKPAHRDHDNQDDTKAKGVIFDASLEKHFGQWHIVILKGFDRTKDKKLAEQVQQKNRVGHSMGALVEKTECSLPHCRFVSDGVSTCEHIAGGAGKGQIIRGHLVYELLRDWVMVESSSVADPASATALSDYFVNA